MNRILVCGLSPLPWENTQKSYGPGIRTWQFAWSLARAGHDVRIVAMKIEDAYHGEEPEERETLDGVDVRRVSPSELLESDLVCREIASYRPAAVVGATIYGSYGLARCSPEMPFWADQFGHVMAEAQAKAAVDGSNKVLPYFWRMVPAVVGRADRISVVSDRQRFAAIGELGCLGRLNYETSGYEFVSVIPCAQLPPNHGDRTTKPLNTPVPPDAFVVLWSGSFNVWSDVETLFEGLELAMDADSRVHFVSTGGAIPGHDEMTYAGFVELVDGSRHRDRFHLQGWVAAEEVESHWETAHLGVLTERRMYEGELGSKNRIIQWLGFGLPVAYNRVGDLGDLLTTRELGLVFKVGNAAQLSERILWAVEHPRELKTMADRAQEYVRRELSFEQTAKPLVQWADEPAHAPDHALRDSIRSPADFAIPPAAPQQSKTLKRLLAVPVVRRVLRKVAGNL